MVGGWWLVVVVGLDPKPDYSPLPPCPLQSQAAVAEWVRAARARAAADQSLELLRAHATVLSASLA